MALSKKIVDKMQTVLIEITQVVGCEYTEEELKRNLKKGIIFRRAVNRKAHENKLDKRCH